MTTTVARGAQAVFFVPSAQSITFTPGVGGTVFIVCVCPGQTQPRPGPIIEATAVEIPAGSTVYMTAVDASATYSDVNAGGAGGAAAFTDLTDAPNAYTNRVGCFPVVNITQDGLRFSDTLSENGAGTRLAGHTTAGTELRDVGDSGIAFQSTGAGGVSLIAEGEGSAVYLDSEGAIDLSMAELFVNGQTAVATQSVLVAGVGTMVFTHGILTGFTPA